jgi:hypothetical protein
MSVRAHAIFPILIPTLISAPISAFNAQALASLVTVAGTALNRRLSQILDALQKSAENEKDEEVREGHSGSFGLHTRYGWLAYVDAPSARIG